jgi:replicative DNA helicase
MNNHPDDDEKGLVALMMNYPTVALEAAVRVTSFCLNHEFYRRVFIAARDSAKADRLSFEDIRLRMDVHGEDIHVLHEVYIFGVIELSASYYMDQVIKAAIRRRIIPDLAELKDMGTDYCDLDEIRIKLREIEQTISMARTHPSWREHGINHCDEIEHRVANFGKKRPLRIGIEAIDRMTNGLRAGRLIVLAARRKTGKSFLAACMINRLTINERIPGLYASLEMNASENFDRMIAIRTGIPTSRVQAGNLNQFELTRIGKVAQEISGAPLVFFDNIYSDEQIMAAIRLHRLKDKIQYVIIDYLQRIECLALQKNKKFEQVDDVGKRLKSLAMDLQIPLVVISQLNATGSVSFAAEVENHLDQKVVMTAHAKKKDVVNVAVELNRYGPTGQCDCVFDGEMNFFTPLASDSEEEMEFVNGSRNGNGAQYHPHADP